MPVRERTLADYFFTAAMHPPTTARREISNEKKLIVVIIGEKYCIFARYNCPQDVFPCGNYRRLAGKAKVHKLPNRAGNPLEVRSLQNRGIRQYLRLHAIHAFCVLLASLLAVPANATMVVTNPSPGVTKYEDDFGTGAAAQKACNDIVSAYGVQCGPSTDVWLGPTGGWYRRPTFGGGAITSPAPNQTSIQVIMYYCEYPNIKGDNHVCMDAGPMVRSDPKNNGMPPTDCDCNDPKKAPKLVGNPINPANGNKIQLEVDFSIAGSPSELALRRFYNSSPVGAVSYRSHLFGKQWTTPYDAAVIFEPSRLVSQCSRRGGDNQLFCTDYPLSTPGAAVTRSDNKTYRYSKSGTGWTADADVNDRLSAQYDTDGATVLGWTYVSANGDSVEQFDAAGRLVKITSRAGATQYLTYSDGSTNDTSLARLPAEAPACNHIQASAPLPVGQLLCVTDTWGRQLNFEHDLVSLLVTNAIGPDGQQFSYEYDGASGGCVAGNDPVKCAVTNLTKVTYPAAAYKTYWYNESALINGGAACPYAQVLGNGFGALNSSLTGIVDENGARYATWRYTCLGEASSSEHALGTDKVTISFGSAASSSFFNTVNYSIGSPAAPVTFGVNIGFSTVNGIGRPGQVYGNCIDCGVTSNATYDVNGNIASASDYRSYLTCYAYDLSRNLETMRVEGLPSGSACATVLTSTSLTAPARRITTQWHPIFRLRTLVAEPLKITTFQYDSSGNLQARTEQGTNDVSGAAGMAATIVGTSRTWNYTYNQFGQILTMKGPRTDVVDLTTYTYDSESNLASVTDAVGNSTMYSNYDGNGRAGRITDSNGTSVDLGYHLRGWVTSRSVTAGGVTESTFYDYDGVGQMKSLTAPDGSKVTFTYDDAHRLTDIADAMGNSIHYTLDFRGNRIREEARDASGTLARQVSRIYDNLNRLQSVTGSKQ